MAWYNVGGFDPQGGHYDISPVGRWLGLPDAGYEAYFKKPPKSSLPDVAAQDQQASQNLLQQLAAYNQQFNQAYANQSQAAAGYGDVIAGRAPSVAQGQLTQGLGTIQQAQQSAASGATGTNAAIARIAAMNNTAQAQAQTNQAAAIQRAAEVAQARDAQAKLYGQQAGESGAMYGQNLSGAVGFAGPAASATAAASAQAQKQFEDNRNFWSNLIQSLGTSMVTKGLGGKGGGSSTMGSGGTAYGGADGYMGLGQSG